MPVPSDITALSTTAASNSPAGSETPSSIDDYLRSHASFIAQMRAVIGGAVDANIPTNLGTAATANLTTSATDTTAGRVLKVGDFGLGTTAVHYDGDLNLLGNVTGFYRTVAGATNYPAGCSDSCFVHIGSGDTYSQTIVGYYTNRMYTRGGEGVVPNIRWEPWVEVWTTSNLVKTTSATDTTAGRMLKVGDFGVGAPILTTNLNTLTGTGLFSCSDITGVPSASVLGWWVHQIDAGPGYWKNQTAWQQANPQAQYVRSSGDGTTWGAWSQAVFADSAALTRTPTAPTAAPGTNTTQIATTAFVLANQSGLGIGQTWQDVTGSRAAGTTYTNSTNKPIFVSVRSNHDDGVAQLTVDGIIVAANGNTAGQGDNRHTVCAVVPNGSTYSYSGSAISLWSEMR